MIVEAKSRTLCCPEIIVLLDPCRFLNGFHQPDIGFYWQFIVKFTLWYTQLS